MKCACCNAILTTELRQNPLYPYLVDFVPLCDSCFHIHKIPYNAIITFIALYDDINEIPNYLQKLINQSLKEYNYLQVIQDLQQRKKILDMFI